MKVQRSIRKKEKQDGQKVRWRAGGFFRVLAIASTKKPHSRWAGAALMTLKPKSQTYQASFFFFGVSSSRVRDPSLFLSILPKRSVALASSFLA